MTSTNPTEENTPDIIEAQYLKMGDIIAIKGEPLVVDSVTKITGSVSIEILLMNGFTHIALKTDKFKVLARESIPPMFFTDSAPLVSSLQDEFNAMCKTIDEAPRGYRRNDAMTKLALWIYKHKDSATFK